MNTNHARRKSVTAALGATVAGAAAAALLSLGAGVAHATDFDPQPDPPGQARGFDPQPEPPARIAIHNSPPALNPPPGLNMPPGLKRVTAGH